MRPIDIVALLSSIVLAIVISTFKVRKSAIPISAFPVFFMFLAPVTIIVHMFFHLAFVSYGIIQSITAHSFEYNFRTYSLYLMAGVLIYFSAQLINRLNLFLVTGAYTGALKAILAICLVSAPVILLNPFGLLPILVCMIALLAMRFSLNHCGAVEREQMKTQHVAVRN